MWKDPLFFQPPKSVPLFREVKNLDFEKEETDERPASLSSSNDEVKNSTRCTNNKISSATTGCTNNKIMSATTMEDFTSKVVLAQNIDEFGFQEDYDTEIYLSPGKIFNWICFTFFFFTNYQALSIMCKSVSKCELPLPRWRHRDVLGRGKGRNLMS